MSHKSLISFSMMEKYSNPSNKSNKSEMSGDEDLQKTVDKLTGGKYKIVSVETVKDSKKDSKKDLNEKELSNSGKSNYGCLLTTIIILLIVLIVITVLNSVQVVVPADASHEEIKEAFEEVYRNLLDLK